MSTFARVMKSSYRTTFFGISGLLAIFSQVANLYLDGDPLTNPDWTLLIPELALAWGLLFARDNRVTSESAGAK